MEFNNRLRKEKRLIKNIGILAIGNFASKLLSFFLVPLYTNVLSTAEYGIYDLSSSIIQILMPILTCNVADGIMVFALSNKEKSGAYYKTGLKYVFISWGIVTIIFWVANKINFLPILSGVIGYIIVLYGIYTLNQLMIQYLKALNKTEHIAISGILSSITMLVGNIYFLLISKLGISGFYLANILGQGVGVIYYTYVVVKDNRHFDELNRMEEIQLIKYSLPLIVVSLSWWVNGALDKYIVAFMCGVSATGLLSVAYKIPSIIGVVQQIFIQAWHISAIEEYGTDESNNFYDGIFRLLNALVCMVCSILIFSSEFLAHFLFLNDFYIAWRYTPFLLVSSVVNASAGFFGPILSARKDSISMAKSGVYGAVSNGILNLALVYILGIQGATLATLISSFIIYAVRLKTVRNIITDSAFQKIYTSWGVLIIQAGLILIGFSYVLQFILFLGILWIYRYEIVVLKNRLVDYINKRVYDHTRR